MDQVFVNLVTNAAQAIGEGTGTITIEIALADHVQEVDARPEVRLSVSDTGCGMSRETFDAFGKTADLFINVSGGSFFPEALSPSCVKLFIDTDPGYNQIILSERPSWSQNVERWCAGVHAHDRHFTYAENFGHPDCTMPAAGIAWRKTRAVTLKQPSTM